MTLLLSDLDVLALTGDPDGVAVTGVEHDSRRAIPGTLFCALPGTKADGVLFAAEAVRRGAVGVVSERPLPEALPSSVVQIRVAPGQARPAMARLAAAYWGHPGRAITMVGVTGTNGKTTVTHLIGAIAAAAGYPSAVLGTLSGVRTTPEATELQRSLATVRDTASGEARPVVAMEVSSHALVAHRVDSLVYDVAAFTNLSHDHLDFHGTMEQYFSAKALLFEPDRARRAVVWVDDPWGARLFGTLRVPGTPVRAGDATDMRIGAARTTFTWRGVEVQVPMTGRVNVANALVAAEVGLALGIEPSVVAAGLAGARPVPGRLELVPGSGPESPTVLVDYAHTPAALELALGEARRLAGPLGGRVLVVVGCGGARDQGKRPLMGEVASRCAEVAVITSDNPRHEDPGRIIDQMLAGVSPSAADAVRRGAVVVEPDRRRAIETALSLARASDVVLLAGKGHETTQETAAGKLPFDDRLVAAEVLGAPRPAAPGAPRLAAPGAPRLAAPGALPDDGPGTAVGGDGGV